MIRLSDKLLVAMEYYGTTLKEFLLSSRALNNYPSYAEKEQRFSTLHEAQAIDIALGIAKGMAYLQSLSVISVSCPIKNNHFADFSLQRLNEFEWLWFIDQCISNSYRCNVINSIFECWKGSAYEVNISYSSGVQWYRAQNLRLRYGLLSASRTCNLTFLTSRSDTAWIQLIFFSLFYL